MEAAALGWADISRALRSRAPRRVLPEPGRRAAVAVILRESPLPGCGLEMLLVRRAEHPQDPWSGHMAFPGGRFEPGDDDITATAIRETAEETGIALSRQGDLLGQLDEVQASSGGKALDLAITPFVFRWQGADRIEISEELASAHWIALSALDDPVARATLPVSHQGRLLDFPCLRVDGQVVWGLTYRMLVDLGERLGVAPLPRDPADATAVDQAR